MFIFPLVRNQITFSVVFVLLLIFLFDCLFDSRYLSNSSTDLQSNQIYVYVKRYESKAIFFHI